MGDAAISSTVSAGSMRVCAEDPICRLSLLNFAVIVTVPVPVSVATAIKVVCSGDSWFGSPIVKLPLLNIPHPIVPE